MQMLSSPHSKPQILLLIDKWDWAFHTIARAIEKHVSDRFAFTICSIEDDPHTQKEFDIIHAFYDDEKWRHYFRRSRSKILRVAYSHCWQIEGQSAMQFYEESLYEAHALTVPSMLLLNAFKEVPCPLYLFPEGVDTQLFHPMKEINREEAVAWAGSDMPIKRLELLRKACENFIPLHTAIGHQYSEKEMPAFFSAASIVACASTAEGCPRPILEGMACGAFPVSTNVGIIPEVLRHKENGYIVDEATPEAFREAFLWCNTHPDILEHARTENRELIRATRQWSSVVQPLVEIYESLLRD